MPFIEKYHRPLNEGGHARTFLTDCSKAFDRFNHDLLMAKISCYEVGRKSLHFLCPYLENETQRAKVNTLYSRFSKIIFGVLQGSILGPLLIAIFICDRF